MWENRTYQRTLRESMYIQQGRLPDFSDVVEGRIEPEDESFPYPVFSINNNLDLHIIPRAENHRLWIVEKTTDKVLAKYSRKEFFWYDEGKAEDAVTALRNQVPGKEQGTGFLDSLRRILTTYLVKEFDRDLSANLRSPAVRLLKSWTTTVQARKNTYPSDDPVTRTEWTIRLVGDETTTGQWKETYNTEDLCQQTPTKFIRDIRRWFPDSLYLTQTGWFDLSRYWIEQAAVNSFAKEDSQPLNNEEVRLRRGRTGRFHLCKKRKTPVCHVTECSGEPAPFDLDELPVAAQLCSHCHSHIKKRLVARKLNTV